MALAFTALVQDRSGLRMDIQLDPVAVAIGGARFIAAPFTLDFFNIAVARSVQFFVHLGDREPLAPALRHGAVFSRNRGRQQNTADSKGAAERKG